MTIGSPAAQKREAGRVRQFAVTTAAVAEAVQNLARRRFTDDDTVVKRIAHVWHAPTLVAATPPRRASGSGLEPAPLPPRPAGLLPGDRAHSRRARPAVRCAPRRGEGGGENSLI
jgi:hypothetical protein